MRIFDAKHGKVKGVVRVLEQPKPAPAPAPKAAAPEPTRGLIAWAEATLQRLFTRQDTLEQERATRQTEAVADLVKAIGQPQARCTWVHKVSYDTYGRITSITSTPQE